MTDREKILANLGNLDPKDYDHIKTFFPIVSGKGCPTCDGTKRYRLNGKWHDCDCELQRLLQKHYFAANIGREYHDICLEHFQGDDREVVVPVVEEYLNNFDANFHYGLGVTFSGPFGTGKTFGMMCVQKELVKRGRRVYNITFEELINAWGASYKDNDSKELLERKLKSVEVLGLDELKSDARNNNGFLLNGFDSVIRHRIANLLPTLITTNMKPIQEESEFGKVYSLLSSRNTRIETVGADARGDLVRNEVYRLAVNNERRPIC